MQPQKYGSMIKLYCSERIGRFLRIAHPPIRNLKRKSAKDSLPDPGARVKINLMWLHKLLIGDRSAPRTVGF
jgi:hypothetical protein